MKKALFGILVIFCGWAASADTRCIASQGLYYVYSTELNQQIGAAGYLSIEYCLMAIRSADPSMTCSVSQGGGSAIFSAKNGQKIGYPDSHFTSVQYCSIAIQNTRDGTVCIPDRRGGIALFDTRYGQVFEYSYNSVEYCKWGSLSARSGDNYICALDSRGRSRIFDRSTQQPSQIRYESTEKCYQSLSQLRGEFKEITAQ